MRTPPLPLAKAEYLRGGITGVTGWLNPSTALYLSGLEVLQRQIPVAGDVCEIGVHHGKSFLTLAVGLPDDQRAVAVDVFDDQQANIDSSGCGDRAVFETNLAAHGAGRCVEVVKASSLRLEELGFVAAGRRFRMFSIDGGHTIEATANDLRIAERTVVDDGVVVLDDLLNPRWLGVITGLFRYWAEGGTLVPAVVVPGKLLLTSTLDQAQAYRQLMSTHFRAAMEAPRVPLGDHEVAVYGEVPWIVRDDAGGAGLLAGSARLTARAARATRPVPVGYVEDLERRLALRRAPTLRQRLIRLVPPPARPWLGRVRRAWSRAPGR